MRVTQEDRDAAADLVIDLQGYEEALDRKIREGRADDHSAVEMARRHRQAAEKAQQERDAAYIEGRMKHYQAKIDKADHEDLDLFEMRQHTIEALEFIATAIRSQGRE